MKKLRYLAGLGVALGFLTSRISRYYGNNIDQISIYTILLAFILISLYYMVKRKYIWTLIVLSLGFPIFIGSIALYLDNSILLLISIILILLLPIEVKIISRFYKSEK